MSIVKLQKVLLENRVYNKESAELRVLIKFFVFILTFKHLLVLFIRILNT